MPLNDTDYYSNEKGFWDKKGAIPYCSLSGFDIRRMEKMIAWQGNGRVLDIGGGSGEISRIVMQKPNTDAVCLDISRSMLKHSPALRVQADSLHLPFADGTFDLIVAGAFFHHLPERTTELFRQCHRILASGGRIVGYDPNAHCIQNKIFMGDGPFRLKLFSPDERPLVPQETADSALKASLHDFQYLYFSFRNKRLTPFEAVQRWGLSPIAIGPLTPLFERWFFWEAKKV